MALMLGIIIGLIVLFFMKDITLIGALIAGLISGIVAKGPVAGIAAGFIVAIVGTALFSMSSLTASSIMGGTNLTGFSIHNIEPISAFKSIFGIAGVAAATIAGLVGGIIRR